MTFKKVILTLDSTRYDHPRHWVKELIKRLYVAGCDAGLCYGTRSAEYLASLGMPKERIILRCQAAPFDHLMEKWKEQKDRPAEIQPLQQGEKYFLFVGRLSLEKGLVTLIQAFQRFRLAHPEFKLCLVGQGPQKQELEALVQKLQLQEAVLFVGARQPDQLLGFYHNAHALVLPSTSEPWGLVVNEAFAMKCPAIVSDHCGCAPDLVMDGKTGYQFRTGDVDSLVEALSKMAAISPSQRASMGAQSFDLIQGFTPQAAAQQMLKGIELIYSLHSR